MPLLPVSLNVKDALCLIVGGGKIAHRKTASLLECGAKVKLVAPQLNEAFQPLLNQIDYQPRIFHPDDCHGVRLIFACTNDSAINLQIAQIAQIAAQSGIWCNVCDDADKSTFHSAACVRRDDITIAISTSGQSPALTRHLRKKIEDCIEPEYGELAKLLAHHRHGEVSAKQFRDFFESAALGKVLLLIRDGELETAKELLARQIPPCKGG
ncbi:MAG: bifunctional precorrin-2 dehydrogenase/sirohydrochlorin ferrochelatase [Abditibacteriaceae bacterium]